MLVYNVEDYVERALLSALNQTYKDIEYLIVDDKGNDKSMDIVRNIIFTHPRREYVRIIEHPVNFGLGAARNSAIDAAKGKYLYFMDSDDEITSDCIQKLYGKMMETDVDVICGTYSQIDGTTVSHSKTKDVIEKDKEQMVLSYFNNRFPVTIWNKFYKISLIQTNNIKCVPHQTIEDNYFTFQILINAQSYSTISDITYIQHIRNTSITGGREGWNEKIFKQWPQIFNDLLDVLQKSSLEPTLKLKVKKRLFKRRIGISKLALKSPHNVQHYINDYLSSSFLKDKDTLFSGMLLFAYFISQMPLVVKKMFLLILIKLHNTN
ncbi:Hyaluronan synthase [Bacteroidales bacterium Barb6]|nr:Hyaluronan synthase [Bacteroidales bacterium Barb6]